MKIRQIRLQNVKCYMDETINFNDGVNFISGINGAGKTTIIESTGYALFDSKPGNLKEFVRYGQKTGIITVEFEANDGRIYRVVRKFGSVNSWVVFDVETDSEVGLHGAVDIIPWLKEAMGIEPEQDSSQLFDDVIGIGQGTFTAPFLERPSDRKDKFNRIFRVEAYRDAFNRVLNVIHRINGIVNALEIEKAEKEGITRDYDGIRQKADELVPEIARLEKAVAGKKEERDRSEITRNALRNREKEIQKMSQDMKVGEERLKSLEDSVRKLESNLKNARLSAELVLSTREGYLAYSAAKKELDSLEKLRSERDDLKDRLARNEKAYGEYVVQIKTGKDAIRADSEEIDDLRTRVTRELDDSKSKTVQAAARLDDILKVKTDLNGFLEKIQEQERIKNEIEKMYERLKRGVDEWVKLRNSIEETELKLLNEDSLKSELSAIKAFENEREEARRERVTLEQELRTLRENLEKAKDGKCPFLDAPCQNVGGDLSVYFKQQIIERQEVLQELTNREKQLDELCAKGEAVRKELFTLENDRASLEKSKQQEQKFSLEFKRVFDNILGLAVNEKAVALASLAGELCRMTEGISAGKKADEPHGLLDDERKSLADAWDIFKASVAAADNPSFDTSKDLLEHVLVAAERTGRFLTACRQLHKELDAQAANQYNTRLSESERAKRDEANAIKQMEDLQTRSKKLDERLLKLKEVELKLLELEMAIADTKGKLAAFSGLDDTITEKRNILSTNQDAYDTYIKHQVEAAKVSPLELEIKRGNEAAAAEKVRLQELKAKLEQLSKDFSEENLKQAESIYEQLNRELAESESSLKERRNDLEELKEKLTFLEKLKVEIAGINEKINRYRHIKDMTGFIRGILNRSGERISAVYREYLANEANRIYRDVSRENVTLEWRDDYEVFLVDILNGRKRERCFRQLSGGEQMTAALAMRLGLLKQLSKVGIGFFDEPTANLDGERRSNLAQIIPQVTGNFDQLFIISHDDSFDSMTENIIQLKKDSGDGTKLV